MSVSNGTTSTQPGEQPAHVEPSVHRSEPGACRVAERDDAHAVIELTGEADLALAAELRALLAECAESEVVLVEMSDCTFMDSSVIATLLDAARDLRAGPSRGVALVAPGGAPARVLELTGTADCLPIFPSVPAALGSSRSGAHG